MPKKRYNTEEVIHKLREADVLLSQGRNIAEVCKQLGVTDQTYYSYQRDGA
jgi:putative transposase